MSPREKSGSKLPQVGVGEYSRRTARKTLPINQRPKGQLFEGDSLATQLAYLQIVARLTNDIRWETPRIGHALSKINATTPAVGDVTVYVARIGLHEVPIAFAHENNVVDEREVEDCYLDLIKNMNDRDFAIATVGGKLDARSRCTHLMRAAQTEGHDLSPHRLTSYQRHAINVDLQRSTEAFGVAAEKAQQIKGNDDLSL